MSDSGLPDLPEELVQHVLAQLVPSVRTPADSMRRSRHLKDGRVKVDTLLSCMRVSKLFHRLAHPLLFHTLDMRLYGTPPAGHFTLLLARDTRLAALVRELHLDLHDEVLTPMKESKDPKVQETLTELVECADQLPNLSLELRERISRGMQRAYIPAERLLLWALCPHLKLLSFSLPDRRGGPVDFGTGEYKRILADLAAEARQQALMKPGNETPNGGLLSAVREIFVENPPGPEDGYAFKTIDCSSLLGLPSLNAYHGWLSNDAIAGIPTPGFCSQLSTLRIQSWELEANRVSILLSACPQLRTLDIRWYNYFGLSEQQEGFANPLQFDRIAALLVKKAAQLQTLRLDTCDYVDQARLRMQRLTSLRDLNELRHLDLPIEALFPNSVNEAESDSDEEPTLGEDSDDDEEGGTTTETSMEALTDMLPFSLRTLKIMDDWGEENDAERLDEQLGHLMADDRFSELRSIRIRRSIAFDDDLVPGGWKLSKNRYWVMLKRT